jgi:bacillopeptidase F
MRVRPRAALAFVLAAALFVVAAPASGAQSTSKVSARVDQELAGGGSTTFFVLFKEHADLATAVQGQQGHGRTRAVVSALHATAAHAQARALERLRGGQAQGHVQAFTPLWAVDAIIVTGDARAVAELAGLEETRAIVANGTVQLEPGEATVVAAPQGEVGWNIQAIRADEVWTRATGQGVLVGLIDTGADHLHPAISEKYGQDGPDHRFSWFDTINNKDVPYDDNGHGTHTTGTVLGGNGIGVAPGAHWIMAKVFPAMGGSTSDKILPAMEWMLAPGDDPDHAPDIVSNSWGGGIIGDPEEDLVFQPVVQAWEAAGILPVFSNGNAGPAAGTVGKPAAYPESFAVGALDYGRYQGIALTTGPAGPGTVIGVRGSGPAPSLLTAPYLFVGTACPEAPLPDLTGKIALVDRGDCPFAEKAVAVTAAGAQAMIVASNAPGTPPAMAGIPADAVPSVSVSQGDGALLKAYQNEPDAEITIDPDTLIDSTPLEVPVIAGFSSRGPSPLDPDVVKPDVSAPGVNVRSSLPGNRYGALSGTSMAAPHVAGTAALMLEVNPSLSIKQLRFIVEATCHPLGDPIPNNTFGHGLIDAFEAVDQVGAAA